MRRRRPIPKPPRGSQILSESPFSRSNHCPTPPPPRQQSKGQPVCNDTLSFDLPAESFTFAQPAPSSPRGSRETRCSQRGGARDSTLKACVAQSSLHLGCPAAQYTSPQLALDGGGKRVPYPSNGAMNHASDAVGHTAEDLKKRF